MADLVSDGKIRVYWVSTISNINAPTVAELNAGTDITPGITPDGLKTDPGTGAVDTSSLASTFTTNAAGRRTFDIAVTMKHQTPTDTYWNLFPYRTAGYLVVRRSVDYSTTWTIAQKAEVYPAETGEPQQASPAENTVQRFVVPMYMTADPATRATVA